MDFNHDGLILLYQTSHLEVVICSQVCCCFCGNSYNQQVKPRSPMVNCVCVFLCVVFVYFFFYDVRSKKKEGVSFMPKRGYFPQNNESADQNEWPSHLSTLHLCIPLKEPPYMQKVISSLLHLILIDTSDYDIDRTSLPTTPIHPHRYIFHFHISFL